MSPSIRSLPLRFIPLGSTRGTALALLLVLAPGALGQRAGARAVAPEVYYGHAEWQPPAFLAEAPGRVDLRPYLPPIGDQGDQGSCVGWATAYAASTCSAALARGRSPEGRGEWLSPTFVYNQINGGQDEGSFVFEALELLRTKGCAPVSEMPYSDRDYRTQPTVRDLKNALEFRVADYARLTSAQGIRDALSLFYPVIIVIQTSPVFMDGANQWQAYGRAEFQRGQNTNQDESIHGLHAVCLVGYDDERGAFLAMNSWGPGWGRRGFCWLAYDLFGRIEPGAGSFVQEAWILEPHDRISLRQLTRTEEYKRTGVVLWPMVTTGTSGGRSSWTWAVEVAPPSLRFEEIARVEWAYDGRESSPVIATDSADNFRCSDVTSSPGLFGIEGVVHFRDGTAARLEHRFLFLHSAAQPFAICVKDRFWGNKAIKSSGEVVPFWSWTAYICGDGDQDTIERVVWHLDPSYPDSEITVSDRAGFGISFRGFEESRIAATVHLLDGRTHELDALVNFDAEPIDELTLQVAPFTRDHVPGQQLDLLLYGPLRDLERIDHVVYRLPASFRRQPIRVSSASGNDFGAVVENIPRAGNETVHVEASVHFEDGTTQIVHGSSF